MPPRTHPAIVELRRAALFWWHYTEGGKRRLSATWEEEMLDVLSEAGGGVRAENTLRRAQACSDPEDCFEVAIEMIAEERKARREAEQRALEQNMLVGIKSQVRSSRCRVRIR